MGGCLGPKTRVGEVYMEIINSIHQEATNTKISEQSQLHLPYNIISEKIQKKGLLRKLIDNLNSHRNHIPDCFMHNYRIVIQSKKIEHYYAGLLIADGIIANIQKSINNSLKNTQKKIKRSTIDEHRGQIQQQSIGYQLDYRLEVYYLKMIIFLIENSHQSYQLVLNSLQRYCRGKLRAMVVSNQILQILKILSANIQRKIHIFKTAQTYSIILNHLKDIQKQDITNKKQLKNFLNWWLGQDRNISLKDIYFEIIKICIHQCITVSSLNFIYELIIQAYDQKLFEKQKIIPIENAIVQIAQGHDLCQQFLQGLFLYLLTYVSYTNNSQYSTQDLNWGVSSQYLKNLYPNILSEKSKVNALGSLRRIVQQKYVDLNQTLKYNKNSLVYAYTFNIYSFIKNFRVCQYILQQFYKTMAYINVQSMQILMQVLLQQLQEQKSSQQFLKVLLGIIRKILQQKKVLQSKSKNLKLFINIKQYYPRSIKLQIIQLVGYIIKYLSRKKLQQQCQQIYIFLYILYQNIFNKYDDIYFKYQLCCSSRSLLKQMQQRNMNMIILAYLQKIYQILPQNNFTIQCYFLLEHLYQGCQIIYPKISLPKQIKQISIKLQQSNNDIIKDQILKFMTQIPQKPKLQQLKLQLIQNRQQYELYFNLISKQFSRDSTIINNQSLQSHNQFIDRGSVIKRDTISAYDSQDNKSFNQILDIIQS